MTEERMIRVVRKDFVRGGVDDGELIPYMLSYIKWNELEPAPPKDWTPYCYDESKEVCTMLGLVNEPPKCWKECPYRKKDD